MNQQELKNKLSEIKDKLIDIEQKADNRIFLLCEAENSYAVNKFMFEDVPLRFVIATGIDSDDCFEVLYHYSYDQTGCFVTVKAFIHDRENPAIDSIAPFLPGAEWIEREIRDILGIDFNNHPDMRRLILSDDWPEGVYPLRKDARMPEKRPDGEPSKRPTVQSKSPACRTVKLSKPVLPVGPFHPLQEEMEFFQLTVDGEIVTDIDVRISYNHRGIEKLSETLQFDQVPFLVSRVCGICSASHPLAYINAVEELAGVTAPDRAHTKAVLDDPVLHARLKGVGTLSKEDAIKYAVTGPTARGSGVAIDVRHDDPYAAYADLDWKVISQPEGDVFAKAVVRLLETFECIKMVREALKKLPDGPIAVEVKEIPPGEGCGHAEAPRGETFHYVRSDGGNRPVRHKVRAPSYVNVPSFKASCIGQHIADVTLTLAAVDPCYSCTERLAVVDGHNSVLHDYEALLKLSREKTARIKKEIGAPEFKLEDF